MAMKTGWPAPHAWSLVASAAWLGLLPLPAVAEPVVTATYLGGPGADQLCGAAVLPDGTLLLAGTLPGARVETWKPREVRGRGDGMVVRLSARGDEVLAVLRFEGQVNDLRTDGSGRAYVTGGFGSARLDPLGNRVLWTSNVGGKEARIAPGPDGAAVVLSGDTVTVLDGQGKPTADWTIAASTCQDVVCDVGRRRVYVTGSTNRRGRAPGQKSMPVEVAFVHAYDLRGGRLWLAYDWSGQEVADRGLMADTRGVRLALGPDGDLYVAGESGGDNTIWLRQSRDLRERLPAAPGDRYQTATNTRANPIAFVGRLDPATGKAEAGTMLLARLKDNKGNAVRPRALAVDGQGRVYVAGVAGVSPPISAGAFGAGTGGGAFFCVFDRRFGRLYATRLCAGTARAVGVGPHTIVVAGEAREGLPVVTPLQARPDGEEDGWAVVFRRETAPPTESPIAAAAPR